MEDYFAGRHELERNVIVCFQPIEPVAFDA